MYDLFRLSRLRSAYHGVYPQSEQLGSQRADLSRILRIFDVDSVRTLRSSVSSFSRENDTSAFLTVDRLWSVSSCHSVSLQRFA